MAPLIKRWQQEYLTWAAATINETPALHPRYEAAKQRRQLAFDLRLYGCLMREICAFLGCSRSIAGMLVKKEARLIEHEAWRRAYRLGLYRD